jgi:hypothetical protein
MRRRAELVQGLEVRDEADTYDTIPLSHHGCGFYDLLVVNVPDVGHVWLDDRASDGRPGCGPAPGVPASTT